MDGFSELFCADSATASVSAPMGATAPASSASPTAQIPGAPAGRYPQPQRHTGPLPVRSAPVRNGQPTRAAGAGAGGSDWKKLRWSKKGGIEAVENDIISVIEGLKSTGGAGEDTSAENDVLLAIDQPDLLLDATGPEMGVGGTEVVEMIMGLRQVCCSSGSDGCWRTD